MVRIGVCEDDKMDLERFQRHIPAAAAQLHIECRATYFTSGQQLIDLVSSGSKFDLLILDIMMDRLNGIETAKKAKELLPDALIGFVTFSMDFAVDAFELDALHYLVKPVTQENILKLFERYLQRAKDVPKTVEFDTMQGKAVFPVRAIKKIESFKKGVAIYTVNQKEPWRVQRSFSSVEAELDKTIFLHISRGLTVNMDFIENICHGECYLDDRTSVLISRSEVRKRYNDYLFNKMKDTREKIDDI